MILKIIEILLIILDLYIFKDIYILFLLNIIIYNYNLITCLFLFIYINYYNINLYHIKCFDILTILIYQLVLNPYLSMIIFSVYFDLKIKNDKSLTIISIILILIPNTFINTIGLLLYHLQFNLNQIT